MMVPATWILAALAALLAPVLEQCHALPRRPNLGPTVDPGVFVITQARKLGKPESVAYRRMEMSKIFLF